MLKKDLTTRKEAIITISNGELHAVVWTDVNRRKVFYKCEPMDETELMDLFGSELEFAYGAGEGGMDLRESGQDSKVLIKEL